MGTTPEGKVKKAISELLRSYRDLYFFMPVQGGYGSPCLDYIGAHQGRAFAIEAKAKGKSPTQRQTDTMTAMTKAGMRVFVIDCEEELKPLRAWLNGLIE